MPRIYRYLRREPNSSGFQALTHRVVPLLRLAPETRSGSDGFSSEKLEDMIRDFQATAAEPMPERFANLIRELRKQSGPLTTNNIPESGPENA